MRVLISSAINVPLDDLPLQQIEERYFGLEDQFVVARVNSKDLQSLFVRKELSIILFNEEVQPAREVLEINEELTALA